MTETLKLSTPITVAGVKYTELKYDYMKITGAMQDEACERAAKPGEMSLAEGDFKFQKYLGFEAIVAENPEIDINDLANEIIGPDIQKCVNIGRNFIFAAYDDVLDTTSDEPTDGTPESTTPASKTSKNKE